MTHPPRNAAYELERLAAKLEAAERDTALKEKIIDSLGAELNAVANERDGLLDCLNEWKELAKSAEKERDALRAKIAEMEKQEPVGKFVQHPSNGLWEQDGYGDNPDANPLYALPGAKGE